MFKSKYRLLLILCLVCGNRAGLFCQSVQEDLLGIRKHYYEPKGQVEYLMKIYYYDKKDMSAPIDSSEGKYCLANNRMNIELDGNRTISDGTYTLTISEEEKLMVLSRPTANPFVEQFSLSFIDSIAGESDVSITKRFVTSSVSSCNFSFKDQAVDSVVIRYNAKSYKLYNLSVYYYQPINEDYDIIPIVKVNYHSEKVQDNISSSKFNLYKYISIDKNEVKLKPQFVDYHLINNLSF